MLAATLTPLIRAIVPGVLTTPVFRRDVFGRLEVLAGHRPRRDLGIGAVFEFDPRSGKSIGKLHEAVERRQVVDVVGDDQRLDRRARREGRGVAGVVVAVAVGLIHLADLAAADELGALFGCGSIGGGEDQLGARKSGERGRVLQAIGRDQLVERVDPKDERTAEVAGRLEAMLDTRKRVKRMDFVKQIPGPQVTGLGQAHEVVDGQIDPQREQTAGHLEVVVRAGDEHDRAVAIVGRDPVADREGGRAARDRVRHEA